MGICLSYDEQLRKWKWSGFMFCMLFDTEEEARAHRNEAWKEHLKRLNAFRFVAGTLASLR